MILFRLIQSAARDINDLRQGREAFCGNKLFD